MNVLFIDDNELFVSNAFKQLKINNEALEKKDISLSSDLNDLSDEVKKIIENEDVIFININLKISNFKRQDFKGLELIKWLRLKKIYNHCVAYSFLSPSSIIKTNPLHSILYSKGITFIQAPFILSNLCFNNDEFAEKENLLPFFRAEVDLVKVRHELANIWGVDRLNWLLDINDKEIKTSFLKEVLKFTAPVINIKDVDRQELNKLIDNFNPNGKKIFYYDDMATKWKPSLQKLFGENNIVTYSPQTTTEEELFKQIRVQGPGCLLLDLRLENEKDIKNVLDYSGGRLLIELKKQFITLPIIMFTATNKAESLRQLLAAGAEHVWTKEGIDDGINNELTLKNTINLVSEVNRCLSKFKNKTYEKIYRSELELSKINPPDKNLLFQLENGNFRNVKTIFIDSNYLIKSIQDKYLSKFYNLLLANKHWGSDNPKFKKKIVIHSDVLNELYIISKQNENFVHSDPKKDKNNPYRVPVCRFLLAKLIEWLYDGLYDEEYEHGREEMIKSISEHKIPKLTNIDYLENIQAQKSTFFIRFFESYELKDNLRVAEINKQIDEINETLSKNTNDLDKIPDLSRLNLHADITFKYIIPDAIKKGGVFFVADDKDCVFNIGNLFNCNDYIVNRKRDYRKKEAIEQELPMKMGNCEVICKVKTINGEFKNSYRHLYAYEFNDLFSEKNKRVNNVLVLKKK